MRSASCSPLVRRGARVLAPDGPLLSCAPCARGEDGRAAVRTAAAHPMMRRSGPSPSGPASVCRATGGRRMMLSERLMMLSERLHGNYDGVRVCGKSAMLSEPTALRDTAVRSGFGGNGICGGVAQPSVCAVSERARRCKNSNERAEKGESDGQRARDGESVRRRESRGSYAHGWA